MDYDSLIPGLLAPSGFGWRPGPFTALQVSGPDAVDFLHRMCTQDLASAAPGAALPAAFLNGKGKLLATCTAGRTEDGVLLSVPEGVYAELHEMLDRYHFSEDLALVPRPDLVCVERIAAGEGASQGAVAPWGEGWHLRLKRCGAQIERYHLTEAQRADTSSWNPDGAPEIGAAAAQCLSFALLQPVVGVDSEPNTLGLEWPIDDHISLTKGCYTGQEIVARIHTYGHTNRSLVLLAVEGAGEIAASTPLCELDDGDPVGRVMSAAAMPEGPMRLAFGFLPTELAQAGTALRLESESGPAATVLAPAG